MKINYVCNNCGGNDLVWDASSRWDVDKQEFVFTGRTEGVDCMSCEAECDPIKERVSA